MKMWLKRKIQRLSAFGQQMSARCWRSCRIKLLFCMLLGRLGNVRQCLDRMMQDRSHRTAGGGGWKGLYISQHMKDNWENFMLRVRIKLQNALTLVSGSASDRCCRWQSSTLAAGSVWPAWSSARNFPRHTFWFPKSFLILSKFSPQVVDASQSHSNWSNCCYSILSCRIWFDLSSCWQWRSWYLFFYWERWRSWLSWYNWNFGCCS